MGLVSNWWIALANCALSERGCRFDLRPVSRQPIPLLALYKVGNLDGEDCGGGCRGL